MSTYINIGTYNDNRQDHHREMTVNVQHGTDVSNLVRQFFAEDIQAEEVTPQQQDNEQELFKYIHPAITDDTERLRVHRQVGNLAKNFPLIDICKHLQQMKKDNLVYLGVKPELMFEELHRLGMPDKETSGYSYKNFLNYFNVN